MDDPTETKRPRSRVKNRKSLTNYITIAVILLFVTSLFLYLRMHGSIHDSPSQSRSSITKTEPPGSKKTAEVYGKKTTKKNVQHSQPPSSNDSTKPLKVQSTTQSGSSEEELHKNAGNSTLATTSKELALLPPTSTQSIQERVDSTIPPVQPAATEKAAEQLPREQKKKHLAQIDQINSFYTHLDQQQYIKNLSLNEPSKVYFSTLLQKLADNPPVVVRETDDLFTLLQNTAHFFRVLGKNNINTLKAILSNEQNSFEQILQAFYSLSSDPEQLQEEYKVSLTPEVLTDYASFFLNTMGGRLYLFRRDSTSRMIVSYYAIIAIHRASQEGNGGHGIDLRPAINSLVDDLENGGNRLQMKEHYLDVLYDLQEIYD